MKDSVLCQLTTKTLTCHPLYRKTPTSRWSNSCCHLYPDGKEMPGWYPSATEDTKDSSLHDWSEYCTDCCSVFELSDGVPLRVAAGLALQPAPEENDRDSDDSGDYDYDGGCYQHQENVFHDELMSKILLYCCGIITNRGGSNFVGTPSPRIYILNE